MKNRFQSVFLILSVIILGCHKSSEDSIPQSSTYKDTVFTNYFKRTTEWIAGDGAISIPLGNGKSFWTFGDSHIGFYEEITHTVPCLFQVRNAGLLMDIHQPQSQTTFIGTGSPKSLFQIGTDNNYWFWPGPGYVFADTVYVFLNQIHATGAGGNFGFETIDSLVVAKMNIHTMAILGYISLGGRNGISFNNGIVQQGNFNYVYGTKNNGFGFGLYVARFPVNNLYADWEYYSASGWTLDMENAISIHSEFSSSFNICKIKNKYVLITTEFSVGCDQGKHIYGYTSKEPMGPFENKKTLWTVDDTLEGHYPVFYLANAHPEYDNGKQELLVTYCINGYGECVDVCINNRKNPDYYRPKAIRVPYSLLGL